MNCTEFTTTGILNALAGDTAYGINVGLLSSPPSFNLGQETSNILENAVGGIPNLQGGIQLVSQEVSIECEFLQINRQNLEMALPGLQTAEWSSAAHASVTLGTGNGAWKLIALTSGVAPNTGYTVVVNAPAGGTTTVATTGTLPARIFTISPKTGETALGLVRAVNADTTANDYIQAGLPSTSDGSGAVASAVSTPFAGGTAGSVVGELFTHKGFWATSDYSRNFVAAFESANTRVAHILRIDNVISMDDFTFQAEDTQVLAGVSMSFTATAVEADYSAATGTWTPPWKWYKLTDVLV